MTTSKQYHLIFKTIADPKGGYLYPSIDVEFDSNNNPLVGIDFVTFLEELDIKDVDRVISHLNDVSFIGNANEKIYEFYGPRDILVSCYANPPRIAFNEIDGVYYIPLLDFLSILNEWKKYLNSISKT